MKHLPASHPTGFATRTHWMNGLFCGVLLLALSSCSGGGDSGGTSAPSSATSGTNVVTGTMPATSVASLVPLTDTRTLFAKIINRLFVDTIAYAAGSASVEVQGTTIKSHPIGGGHFQLVGVPDGLINLKFTTPDGATGMLPLTLPSGGGAFIDLGLVVVHRTGHVEYSPSHSNNQFPNSLQARGAITGVINPLTAAPTDGSCRTFQVAGVTFCFDSHTRFDPPLNGQNPFVNSGGPNPVAVVTGEPTDDPASTVFRARRVQRNHGASSANNNTVTVIAPITNFDSDTLTVFSTPPITDNDPNTADHPNAHAITFNTAQAKFDPRSLAENLSKGLFVEITTPKKNGTSPAVSLDAQGNQIATADRVRLVRVPKPPTGELLSIEGTLSSLIPNSKTFGMNNDTVFVHVTDNVTRFEDPLSSFSSLEVGQTLEVTALLPKTVGGPLEALTIKLAETPVVAIEAHGQISSLNQTNRTFVVAGISFCYDCNAVNTEFMDVTAETLADGQTVRVLGTAVVDGLSTATRVEREQDPLPMAISTE